MHYFFLYLFALIFLVACETSTPSEGIKEEEEKRTSFVDEQGQTRTTEVYTPYKDSITKTRTTVFVSSKKENGYAYDVTYRNAQPQELAKVYQQRYFSIDTITTKEYPYQYKALLQDQRLLGDERVQQSGNIIATVKSKEALSYEQGRAKAKLLLTHLNQLYNQRKTFAPTQISFEDDFPILTGEQILDNSTFHYSFIHSPSIDTALFWSNQRKDHTPNKQSYLVTGMDTLLVNFQYQVKNTTVPINWIEF